MLANLAASVVVGKLGTSAVTNTELALALGEQSVHLDGGELYHGHFKMQHPANRRLSESMGVRARALPDRRHRRNGRFRSYQATLLHNA